MGEQEWATPECILIAFPACWLGAHLIFFLDCLVAAAVRFQSLVSIELPGGRDKFHSPQR